MGHIIKHSDAMLLIYNTIIGFIIKIFYIVCIVNFSKKKFTLLYEHLLVPYKLLTVLATIFAIKADHISGQEIVLRKDMSYGRTCLSGVLKEVMLCWRICLMGGHVLQECMSSG